MYANHPRATLVIALAFGLILPATAIAADGSVDPDGRLAAAARELYATAMQSRVGYDALAELCDNYGHRLSGTETLEAAIDWSAEKMREFGFEKPIIALTASVLSEGEKHCREAGMNGFLSKPYDVRDLHIRVTS